MVVGSDCGLGWRASWAVHGSVHGCGAWMHGWWLGGGDNIDIYDIWIDQKKLLYNTIKALCALPSFWAQVRINKQWYHCREWQNCKCTWILCGYICLKNYIIFMSYFFLFPSDAVGIWVTDFSGIQMVEIFGVNWARRPSSFNWVILWKFNHFFLLKSDVHSARSTNQLIR